MKRVMAAVTLVVCLVSTGLQAAERRVALVIGNGAYADSPLKNPLNDARDIRDRLLGLGFDKTDIVYRENLKTAEIGPMLREFREKLNGDAVAVVFYAGHGVQVGGENFLPTVDARVDGEDDLPQQSIRLGNLLDLLRRSRTRLNLVFLDACRNNPYKRGFRDGVRGLEKMSPASGTLISYATQPGLVADDGKGRNGVFTGQLLSNMAAPGLPVELMIKRVASGVYASTEGKQDPWQEGSIRGDFYFAPGAPPPPPPPPEPPRPVAPQSGQVIKDCADCPELVVLPKGSFVMGSPDSEPERSRDEGPQRTVRINYTLAVGRYEITQGQWKAVMGSNPSNFSACGDTCPVENVSWDMAQEYLKKLNAKSGQQYRLLSEAEWEYAARAGTTTPFHTGKTITPQQANFDGNYTYNGSAKGVYRDKTTKVGSFGANAFGLPDMHGNVWEWVEDVWHDNYTGAPTDGSAWKVGGDSARCVLRGGSWVSDPGLLRSAGRFWGTPGNRNGITGFRIARTFSL